jgi:DNA-binding transcriptional ArsR family regulator
MYGETQPTGDTDLASVGALLAEPARAKVLLALSDGRSLPATMLAAEAGVAASTASHHLARLVDGGLLSVVARGRHLYYALAGRDVADLLEAVARVAPPQPVTSLRQGTRAHALRYARRCYDHLAGRLGVALMRALLARGCLTGGDGRHDPARARSDRLSAPGRDVDYELTPAGRELLADLGVRLPLRRREVRYCVDWSEQAHHLSGGAGCGLLDRVLELDWVRRGPVARTIHVTPAGAAGLRDAFGLEWEPAPPALLRAAAA